MTGKLMVIQEPDICISCAQPLPSKTCAWWDGTERTLTCTTCRPTGLANPYVTRTTLPGPVPIDSGSIAASPEHQRRVGDVPSRPGVIFGEQLIGDIGVHVADQSPSTTSVTEAPVEDDGEGGLAAFLEREVGHAATLLHDRRVPMKRGNIDHLVVASTGIWVVDVKSYSGKVERRNVGGRRTPEPRLFVAHRNQTTLVAAITERTKAVARALEATGFSNVPIRCCLCLTSADWPFRPEPFLIDGVWVGWPRALTKALRTTPILERSTVATLADHLSAQFPASN